MKLNRIWVVILLACFIASSSASTIKTSCMRAGILSKGLSIGMGYLSGCMMYVGSEDVSVSVIIALITTCIVYPLVRWYENKHIPEVIFNNKYVSNYDKKLIKIALTCKTPTIYIEKIERRYLKSEEYLLAAFADMSSVHTKLTQRRKSLVYADTLCFRAKDQELRKKIKEEIEQISKQLDDIAEAILILKNDERWSGQVKKKRMKEIKELVERVARMRTTCMYNPPAYQVPPVPHHVMFPPNLMFSPMYFQSAMPNPVIFGPR